MNLRHSSLKITMMLLYQILGDLLIYLIVLWTHYLPNLLHINLKEIYQIRYKYIIIYNILLKQTSLYYI